MRVLRAFRQQRLEIKQALVFALQKEGDELIEVGEALVDFSVQLNPVVTAKSALVILIPDALADCTSRSSRRGVKMTTRLLRPLSTNNRIP